MLPMIKLVKKYKLSLYFQTSGVILPRKYSLIKVFKNRFLYNRGDLRAHFCVPQRARAIRFHSKTTNFQRLFQRVSFLRTSRSFSDRACRELKHYSDKKKLETRDFRSTSPDRHLSGECRIDFGKFLQMGNAGTREKPQSHKTDNRSKVSHRSSRHHQSGSQKSSRYTAAPSKTLSEKKRDLMILKKQQEELERQAKVSLRLKEQQNKMKQYVLEQQSSLELEKLAEEHRKKLAEIELKGLELEDELSEISENAEESGLTRISPQLTIDEKDRTRHWVESVDHNQPDAVVVPNQEQHVRSIAPEATYPASTNYLVSSSFTGVNNGQAASSDPGLYYSNHIHGQQHNLSNLVRSQVSVNNPVGLQQVIQPVSNNLPQQTFLSTHPVLQTSGNPTFPSTHPAIQTQVQ